MLKFLHEANDNKDAKAIAISLVFSENSRAKNLFTSINFIKLPYRNRGWERDWCNKAIESKI